LLVYFEVFEDVNDAIRREKQIKKVSKQKKIDLIKRMNPGWKDLSYELWDCHVAKLLVMTYCVLMT
jgi:putative endonuclease